MKRENIEALALAGRIQPEHEGIHARLKNWAAWSQDRIRSGRCGSMERRWRSPQIWHAPEPRIEWDSLDAAALHTIVCAVPAEPWRWSLHMHYVYRLEYGDIRKRLAIPRKTLVEDVLHEARAMAKNIARRHA